MPPGLAVFAVSDRALKKAETISARGYYFDFLEFKANHDKNMTPSTPSITHIYGLQFKLGQFEKEGLENRYARHAKMAQKTREWAKSRGFELFPKAGYESLTLTCVKNNRNIDVAKLQKALKDKYKVLIDGGYGQIKGKTFRLAHMGDETVETVSELHVMLDDCLSSL
jgi:aspartate aminotransferase-like enzyme